MKLRVSPGAKRTSLKGRYGEGALKLAVAGPPVDGKANAEIERFLAGPLGISRSSVDTVRGSSSRDKAVFVGGVDAATARALSGRSR